MKTQNTINTVSKRIGRSIILGTLLLLTSQSYAQDIITMTNGNKIEAKVSEIEVNAVKYKKYNNLSGPLYTIRISDIYTIQYENGTIEDFNKSVREIKAQEKELKSKNKKLDDKGFFVDGLVGTTFFKTTRQEQQYVQTDPIYGGGYYQTVSQVYQNIAPMLGVRLGSKFYLGDQKKKFNSGLQMNWLALQLGLEDGAGVNMQLFNPAYTGILKFNEETGMEFNLAGGFSMFGTDFRGNSFGFLPIFNFDPSLGLNINPGIKLRMKGFGIGLEYTYMSTVGVNDRMTHNTINFSIGRKF